MATAPTATTTSDAFDSPAVLAESVEMLRTIMRTSDKESARLSAARTLANLAARFITRRPSPPRDTDHPEPPRGPMITTVNDAPSATTASSSAAPQTVAAPINTSSRQPQPSPASAHPRRAARSRRASAASAASTTTTTLARAAGAAASPATDSHTAATPTRRFVTAIPPLIDKHYPAPNAVLDPLFDILASPIPTDPMTEAELDDLQAIHTNLKREDLKNPRRAARWRHQLREDRFWKAYWQEWRKNPDEFKRVYEAFMNRKPAPDATTAPVSASISPAISPPEPLASASGPEAATSPAPLIPSPPHPIINSS